MVLNALRLSPDQVVYEINVSHFKFKWNWRSFTSIYVCVVHPSLKSQILFFDTNLLALILLLSDPTSVLSPCHKTMR